MDTYGFDYAYGITIAKINEALSTNLAGVKMPVRFSTVDPDSGTTVTLDALLGPWQVVAGGQLSLLRLRIPFSDGYLALEGGALPNDSYDVTDVATIVELQLGWLGPGNALEAKGSGDATQLAFDPSTTEPNNPGYVAAITVDDPDGNLDTISKAILKTYLVNALVTNKTNVQYILANINPKPQDLASWLQPVSWTYFYIDSPQVLAFLCMMSGSPPSQPAFDTSAIGSADCGLLIAQSRFFQNVVLSGVQAAFPGGSFSVSTTAGISAIANSGDFNLGQITASTLKVTTSSAGDGLSVYAEGGGPLKFFFGLGKLPNASYSWSITSTNPQHFANGQLTFATDPNPVTTQDHTIHWYDWVLLVAVGIFDVSDLVEAIQGAISGFHDQLEQVGIGTINQEAQSATGGSVVNLQQIVDWKLGQQQFSAVSAGLQGPLYVTGNFA